MSTPGQSSYHHNGHRHSNHHYHHDHHGGGRQSRRQHDPAVISHIHGSSGHATRLRLDEEYRAKGALDRFRDPDEPLPNGDPYVRPEDVHTMHPSHSLVSIQRRMSRFPMREELQRAAQLNSKTIEHDMMMHVLANYSEQMIAAAYGGFGSIDIYVPKTSMHFPSYDHDKVIRLVMNELRVRQFSIFYNPAVDSEIIVAGWIMVPQNDGHDERQ